MVNSFFKQLAWFLLILALQVLVFDHVHIFGHATPFVAVYFVLLFPGNSSRTGILLWSFLFGLVADTFTNTPCGSLSNSYGNGSAMAFED